MPDSIKLYRFLGYDSALRTIEQRSFRVGRLKEFNDPFEWRVGVTNIVSEGEIVAQACLDSFIDEMNSQFGILCFSETASDPVLWTHYAAVHTGVAFEVDYLVDPETLPKVEYTDDRPVMDANVLNDPSQVDAHLLPLLNRMLRQKAPSWSYEQEYRVHIGLEDCETAGGHYFQKIPDDFLTRVILGFRCPLDTRYVRKALDRAGLDATEVVRAKMDQLSYTILC